MKERESTKEQPYLHSVSPVLILCVFLLVYVNLYYINTTKCVYLYWINIYSLYQRQ